MNKKADLLNVLFDTSPLKGGHAVRGIGMYTRELFKELSLSDELRIYKNSDSIDTKKYIIHYPYFDLFFSTLPLLSTHKKIVTIHDVIPLKFPEYYPSGKKGALRYQKQKLALKNTSAVITDSESSKMDIIEYLSVPEEKIAVVALAANPEISAENLPAEHTIRKRYKLPDSYVLYVGDINYNKNIPQLVKMLKFLPVNVHLVCVGRNFVPHDIPEWQWIETQVALSDVADRVVFIPTILTENNKDLSAIYHYAQCYIQPSLAEGFGLPVLEAMKAKTPVVSTNTTSLPEVGGEFVLYSEPNAESLAKQVVQVLDWNQRDRKKRIKLAFDWQEQFTWKRTAEQTIDVYKKVAFG